MSGKSAKTLTNHEYVEVENLRREGLERAFEAVRRRCIRSPELREESGEVQDKSATADSSLG
jgi:hypothetical protein